MPVVETLARFAWLLLGLLVPGEVLLRALRVPSSVGGAFAASAVVLFGWVVALTLAHLPISAGTLTTGLSLITISAGIVAGIRARGSPVPRGGQTPPLIFFYGLGRW